jgi:hypothetical protein
MIDEKMQPPMDSAEQAQPAPTEMATSGNKAMGPLLQKVVDQIEEKVPEESKEAYSRLVTAGLKIMFDPATHANMQLVKNPNSVKDLPNTVSTGIAGLMYLMYMQSNKKLDRVALVYAGIVLMCHALDFAERSLGATITPQIVADTTKRLTDHIFQRLGITPEQIMEAARYGAQQKGIEMPSESDETTSEQQEPPGQPEPTGQPEPGGIIGDKMR